MSSSASATGARPPSPGPPAAMRAQPGHARRAGGRRRSDRPRRQGSCCLRVKGYDKHPGVVKGGCCRAVVLALTLALLPGCRTTSRAEGPTATLGTAPPSTTTTNPYAVPSVIDASYVNRVLAGLDAVVGDTTRLVLQARQIPPEAIDRLRAIYQDTTTFQLVLDGFEGDIRRGFANYKPQPGNKRAIVTELLSTAATCIFARVERDFSAVGIDPRPVNPQWVALKPLDTSRDPNGYNKTSWSYVYDGYPPNRTQPANPCGQ